MYTEFVQKRLSQERIKAGYTQRQLAELTGIERTTLAKIELGTRKPDAEVIGILAEFYGISTDWLFGLGHKELSNNNTKNKNPS